MLRNRPFHWLLCFATAIVASACTSTKFTPPSAQLRESLGTIALVARPLPGCLAVATPAGGAGEAALIGAGQLGGAWERFFSHR